MGGELFGVSHRRVAHSRAARAGADFLPSAIAGRQENLGLRDRNFTKEKRRATRFRIARPFRANTSFQRLS